MPPSFTNLSIVLNNPVDYLFDSEVDLHRGELQYCGPHVLAAISRAIKLAKLSHGLADLDKEAAYCCFESTTGGGKRVLSLLASFLEQLRELFVVPKLHQSPSDITSKTVDSIASYIDFMVNTFDILSSPTNSWIIIPGQIGILSKRLKQLLAIFPDTPFQCTELEMEGGNNILAEIESIATKIGIFLYSFFFTTDHVTLTTMDLELSLLLSKLDAVEEMIKQHCVKVLEQQKSTTPNYSSYSIFIVDSLLGDLNHILNHKADLIVEVKDQIITLHDEFYSSRSVLKNTELHENKELIECEIQLINLAYQAEPIVACLLAREIPVWYLAVRLSIIIQKSKPIEAKLSNIKLNSGISGKQIAESFSEVSSSRVATKSIPMADEIIIGFKEVTTQIVSQLTGEPHPQQIISIVGMGGLGKTTLAKRLFNDSRVRLRFDKRSWCVVSQTYQRRNSLIDILICVSTLDKDTILKMEDHQLVDHLHKSLKGTRYLLVMDDIWEIEVWHDLRRYFPDDKNGSRILFTTRNKDVALNASSEPFIHDLPLLTDDQCWDLLKTKVFPNSYFSPELKDVGTEIAKNCKGLPLTVVGIAGVLATMEKKEGLWQEVATHLSSYISKGRDTLELSYKLLPSHLKPCFLYFGMFKEDKEIKVRHLLSLWISQGFIGWVGCKSPDDVAEDYLLELINRNMVQLVEKRSDKGAKTCTVHDLMRDIALRLADKENFLKVINEEYSIHEEHHQICIYSGSNHFMSRPFRPHIRSLSGNFQDLSSITLSMIRLKVLKLSKPDIEYDGTTLELLLQLRHLECDGDLRNFGNHMKLEFLRLGKSPDMDIKLNMPELKHLQFSKYQTIPEGWDYSLSNSLQTLSRVIINDSNAEERLRHFSHLRHLRCCYSQDWHTTSSNLNEDLYDFKLSQDLYDISNYSKSPDLHSLHRLVSLNVESSIFEEYAEFKFPVNVEKLTIHRMPMTPGVLSSIGALSKLEILKMKQVAFRDQRWDISDNQFMEVKCLKLYDVVLREWNISDDHFPSIERFSLIRDQYWCPLPSKLGYIPTMQRIEVVNCGGHVESFARKIIEEQREEGNEQLQVIIN